MKNIDFFWLFFIHFLHCWNWLLFQWFTNIWAFSNRIFQRIFHYFWPKKSNFLSKIDDYSSFLVLIIVFWLEIIKKRFYGLPNIIFEKSIFCDQNEILNAKNEKYHLNVVISKGVLHPHDLQNWIFWDPVMIMTWYLG